ncbi:MAG TPA: hypothetical protein VGB06_02820 [Solirubrobacterales bacterium]|jgi:hypothetical protein
MSSEAIAIISGALSGGFALAGVGVSSWIASRRQRAEFREETVLELAGMERLVWGDNWIELNAHLQRQQARWSISGLPSSLVDDFQAISKACWRDGRQTVEQSSGKHHMISVTLLDAREAVHNAARAALMREGSRRYRESLVADASAQIEAARARMPAAFR